MTLINLTLDDFTAGIRSQAHLSSAYTEDRQVNRTTRRRCRTREQGSALLLVGHAIEYLVDSRLIKQQDTTGAEREALAILLNVNQAVYNEGAEILPLGSRFLNWFRGGATPPSSNASA